MPASAIHQLSVPSRRRPAVPGMVADLSWGNRFDTVINKDPQATEVWTLVIDTASNSEVYGVNLTSPASASIAITSDGTATTTEIAAAIALAWNLNPVCRGIAQAVATTATVVFTGVFAGVVWAMEEDENAAKETLTNTTDAADAAAVPFGRAVISSAYQANEADELGILAASTKFTAQVDTLVVTYAAGEIYTVGITIEGTRYEVNVAANTDSATTGTDIVTAINAIMPAVSVLASGTGTVTLTAELAGKAFVTDVGLKSGTIARLALTLTTSLNTDFNRSFVGVSTYTYDEAQTSLTTEASSYAANAGVNVLQEGRIWVENTQTIVHHSDVYVELDGTGSNAGKFYNTTSSTRVKVSSNILQWRRADHDASGPFTASDGDVAQLSVRARAA